MGIYQDLDEIRASCSYPDKMRCRMIAQFYRRKHHRICKYYIRTLTHKRDRDILMQYFGTKFVAQGRAEKAYLDRFIKVVKGSERTDFDDAGDYYIGDNKQFEEWFKACRKSFGSAGTWEKVKSQYFKF